MISEKLRKAARAGEVPVELGDLLSGQDLTWAILSKQAHPLIKEELAQDGIDLFCINNEWYLGPLGS